MCAKEEVRLMNLLHCSNKNSMQSSRTGYLYAHSLSYRQWWCYKVKEVKIRQRVINRGVSHQGLQRHRSAVEGDIRRGQCMSDCCYYLWSAKPRAPHPGRGLVASMGLVQGEWTQLLCLSSLSAAPCSGRNHICLLGLVCTQE